MTRRWILISLFFLATMPTLTYGKEKLKIGFMFSSGEQRDVLFKVTKDFIKLHPELDVNRREVEQEFYKKNVEKWLQATPAEFDVMFWFAGQKLKSLVGKGYLSPIDSLWNSQSWNADFSKGSKSAVSVNNSTYGLPLSYYQWGFYYRKSIFEQFGLTPPKTWDELLMICDKLKANKIVPFTLGSKYLWTAAGWFDYLNLRVNGMAFHNKLMAGKAAYNSPQVKKVFAKWKELLDRDAFIKNHNTLDWRKALPYLYLKKAGMLLMGNFVIPQIPDNVKNDIDFFRFPKIDQKVAFYEEAPMDIMVVPKNSQNPKGAKMFLKYLARPEVQFTINSKTGMISPNLKSKPSEDRFIRAGTKILGEAEAISQFYDRDTPKALADKGMKAMVEFMKEPSKIDTILDQLEQERAKIFGAISN